ncbi:hypothetical protein TNCV_4445541 [Trichonephila clavipes]|nr:hypothetical protein TNCV_4445541 [Trichonephila clavipes]
MGSNPNTTEDPPCRRGLKYVKLSRLKSLPIVWCGNSGRGDASSYLVLVTCLRLTIIRSIAKTPRVALEQGWADFSGVRATSNFFKAITPKYLNGPLVDHDRRNAHPCFRMRLKLKSIIKQREVHWLRTCDEAHFWLNGYVNKQNGRIWSDANPQVYVETPLHPEKLTVWCALWAGGILLQKR